jgi:hypothetical protein
MCVPVIFLGQRLVNAVVKVFVVGEDDMSANVVQLSQTLEFASIEMRVERHTKPSLVTSVEAKPPGISFESTISQEGPF